MNEIEFPYRPVGIIEIGDTPQINQYIYSQFKGNSCLLNSYKTACANDDMMVEGILLIYSNGIFNHALRHCWNRSNENKAYYDVTKDYVWATDSFQQRIKTTLGDDVTYRYISCMEYHHKKANLTGPEIMFYYKYDTLLTYITDHLNKNSNLTTLLDEYGEYLHHISFTQSSL